MFGTILAFIALVALSQVKGLFDRIRLPFLLQLQVEFVEKIKVGRIRFLQVQGRLDSISVVLFFEWMANLLSNNLDFTGYSPVMILAGLLFFSLIIRYFFASMAAYVTTMIPVFFTIGLVAQVPALPLVFLICFSAAYGSLLTHYGGAAGAVLFAPGYVDQVTWWKIGAVIVVISYLVNLGIGLPYWKLIGLW